MTNHKLTLDELKVQSFVTDFNKEQHQTGDVNGGFFIYQLPRPEINPIYLNTDILAKTCQACTHHCGFSDTVFQPPILY